MSRINNIFIFLIVFSTTVFAQSQEDNEVAPPQDLNDQYKSFKEEAETYGEFKVLRESKLDNFWSVVIDSLNTQKESNMKSQQIIEDQLAEIDKLNNDFKSNEERFQSNEYAATHIAFLGIDFSKSSFKLILSIIVGGLTLLIVAGYAQYKHNKTIALKNTAECKKLEHEFEELRKKSLEKQVRLSRELQTQINLVEELQHKTTITKKISA